MAKTPRTPESGVPLGTRLSRLTGIGRGKDIALPMGPRDVADPRLKTPNVRRSLGEAAKGLQTVRGLTKGKR